MESIKPIERIPMLEFIKEIVASLRKTSTERISNPFYGVFIMTWLAFNWEAVAIILFSDLPMQERVRFINSAYSLIFLYPLLFAIFLTFILPWCTEKITFFQSKSISRTSSLLAIRKKKMLTADISVERFRAKKDVAYERYKVGSEKEIQSMRESIIESTERTGQLTKERDDALQRLAAMKNITQENHKLESLLKASLTANEKTNKDLQSQNKYISELKKQVDMLEEDKASYFNQNQRMLASIDGLLENYPALFYRKENDNMIMLRSGVANELALYNAKKELGKLSYVNNKSPAVSMKDTMTVYPRNEKDNPT